MLYVSNPPKCIQLTLLVCVCWQAAAEAPPASTPRTASDMAAVAADSEPEEAKDTEPEETVSHSTDAIITRQKS